MRHYLFHLLGMVDAAYQAQRLNASQDHDGYLLACREYDFLLALLRESASRWTGTIELLDMTEKGIRSYLEEKHIRESQ